MSCIKVYTIVDYLANLLAVSSFNDVIINGLQVEGDKNITTIATAVTPTYYVIQEAERRGADLLLTHHGLLLRNGPGIIQGVLRNRLSLLLSSKMHLLSYHLPLDASELYGNAYPVAKKLAWKNLSGFGDVYGKKVGVQGELPSKLSSNQLHDACKKLWGKEGTVLGANEAISKVAFVSGSAHKMVHEAIAEGIDCLITGTVDDSTWEIVRENSIVVMAFGHYRTEEIGIQLLGEHVAQTFDLKTFFLQETNPL
jgi:dinuclear metal center YbgI/SA1388 family protein